MLAKGNRPNHVLHLILTILTVGIWGIVWILLAAFGGEERVLMTVDEYGTVTARASGRRGKVKVYSAAMPANPVRQGYDEQRRSG